jgi:hypothetical protein
MFEIYFCVIDQSKWRIAGEKKGKPTELGRQPI